MDPSSSKLPTRESLEEQMRNLAVNTDSPANVPSTADLGDEAEQSDEPTDAATLTYDTTPHESTPESSGPVSSAPKAAGPLPSPDGDEEETLYGDPSDEDDGEGEWITPSNVALHKSRALDLLPSSGGSKKSGPVKQMAAACMTADFAMQNVLLYLDLSLVGVEGKRIHSVKTWVLRCHACFKWVRFLHPWFRHSS
jgi:RNA-binding protein NOB1